MRRRIEVAPLNVGMHVEHRPDIELEVTSGTVSRPNAARFTRAGCRPPLPRGHRHGLQILGSSRCDMAGICTTSGIAHAVARIDPKIGRGLRARIGRDQHVVRRLLLRDPGQRRQRAVHIHRQSRSIRAPETHASRPRRARAPRSGRFPRPDAKAAPGPARIPGRRSAPADRSSAPDRRCPPVEKRTAAARTAPAVRRRNIGDELRRRRVLLRSGEIKISPSIGPTVAESLSAILMPL